MNAPSTFNVVMLPLPALRQAVALLAPIANPRQGTPILSHIRIHASGAAATLTAYNLDQHLTITIPAMPISNSVCSICLPCAPLARLLQRLQGDQVSISIGEDGKATIAGSGISATLNSMAAVDFPVMEALGDVPPVHWPTAAVAHALGFVSPAISTEETRYYLNGVCIAGQGEDETFTPQIVATDGHRIHLVDFPVGTPWPAGRPILPTGAVKILRKLLDVADDQQWMTGHWAGFKAVFTIGRFQLITKLIDGTFPDYIRALPAPDENHRAFTAAAADLVGAIKLANSISTEKTRAVRMKDIHGFWHVETVSPENGTLTVMVPGGMVAQQGEYSGTLGFNAAYLAQCASVFGKAEITVTSAKDSSSPVLFTATDLPMQRAVLMPMRV